MKAQQLKNAILQLAIQGKLVPQDPNDEPASVLLEKIQAEKEKLIAEGKIKKSKKTSDKLPYTQDDFPFEIPESWVWVTLGEYLDVRDGTHDTPKYVTSGIPLVTSKNLNNGKLDFSNIKYISEADHSQISLRSKVDVGDILFAMIGSIGNPVLIKETCNFSIKNIGLFKKYIIETNMEYIYYILLELQDDMRKKASGGVQSFVSLSFLRNYLIPLPPLNEQKRIVAKLEEILPFIDEYDKKEQKLTALHQQFPEQLKKSILQSAIQGKLVEQDPSDEPASELVKRIQAEKERLISEKKIKKPKVKSEIVVRDNLPFEIVNGVERCIADEAPFEIPESWVWVRFENFVNFKLGKTPARSEDKYWNNPKHHWVSISDMNDGGIINNTKEKVSELAKIECFSDLSPKNTLLMSFKLSIGKVSITNIEAFHNEAIISIFPYVNTNYISRNYLFHILNEMTYYIPKTTAIKGNTLNSALLSSMLIPLPPLNEQKHIVEKIEELFSCIEYL